MFHQKTERDNPFLQKQNSVETRFPIYGNGKNDFNNREKSAKKQFTGFQSGMTFKGGRKMGNGGIPQQGTHIRHA